MESLENIVGEKRVFNQAQDTPEEKRQKLDDNENRENNEIEQNNKLNEQQPLDPNETPVLPHIEQITNSLETTNEGQSEEFVQKVKEEETPTNAEPPITTQSSIHLLTNPITEEEEENNNKTNTTTPNAEIIIEKTEINIFNNNNNEDNHPTESVNQNEAGNDSEIDFIKTTASDAEFGNALKELTDGLEQQYLQQLQGGEPITLFQAPGISTENSSEVNDTENERFIHEISGISNPLQALTPRRTRAKKQEMIEEEEIDPENKWSKLATERLLELFHSFGKRKVIDDKLHDEILDCLKRGANPAVTLSSPDESSFYSFLTVAAECGDMKLVKHLLETYPSEFSDFDKSHALHTALRCREQEIAELLIKENTPINREMVMEMFDIKMNDDLDRKTLPLSALLTKIDEGKFPPQDLFLPELLNRAIYADNVAALKLLFSQRNADVLPLLEQATPVNRTIRAGRGKTNDIGDGVPPLTYAAIMERTDCLEVFLEGNGDPNFICNEMGGTLLHIAGDKGNCELIELLLEYNADPRIINSRGLTVISRTRGRKARKFVRDAINRFEKREGGLNNHQHLQQSFPRHSSVDSESAMQIKNVLLSNDHISPLHSLNPLYNYNSLHPLPGMSSLTNSPLQAMTLQNISSLSNGSPFLPQLNTLAAMQEPLHGQIPPASSIISQLSPNSPFNLSPRNDHPL